MLPSLALGILNRIDKIADNSQLISISAYQASLVMPGNMCKPKAGKKK